MKNEENLSELEQAIKEFWKDNGKPIAVNARHTTVTVEPKFIVGNKINPEIAKKIVNVYLSQLSSDKIVNEQIVITNDGLKMFDQGKVVLEIVNEKYVDSISNKVTSKLGHELARRQKKQGGTYMHSKEVEQYTYGEIKQALVEFMMDTEKHDSKNLLKDAILLLVKE